MERLFKILSESLGMETVISAVIVCILMMIVKKLKPKTSPRQEIVIRFLISIAVHLLFTLITKGDSAQIFQNAMSVCGVSMIICALLTGKVDENEVKEMMSTFLPDLSEEDYEEIIDALNGESASAQAVIPAVYEGVDSENSNQTATD